MNILGISAFYHDSAACLVQDGEIVAAVQEERFTRIKHDSGYPKNAIDYCVSFGKPDIVVFYDKPFLKFERLLMAYLSEVPHGLRSWLMSIPMWMKDKLWLKDYLIKNTGCENILFTEHHEAHAASAFYPSPFQKAAFITIDGVGEWATTSWGMGRNNKLKIMQELSFPHSLGLLYSAFTYYTGFKVNSGEYKMMGLAPYGNPAYCGAIRGNLIDIRPDGSFKINMDYFDWVSGLKMVNKKFERLFGFPPRKPESPITQEYMDMAASIQLVIEYAITTMAEHVHKQTEMENLCLAGGVALNCVANGRLLRESPFKNIWIQPAAGDAGGALGAALSVWYSYLGNKRIAKVDAQHYSYLGTEYNNKEIKEFLDSYCLKYTQYLNDGLLSLEVAELIKQGNVVGWFQGRMEFGPRALGSRSILGDARSEKMQSLMNLKIKYRESFRPFAPTVLEDKCADWFDLKCSSPYMLLTADVKKSKRIKNSSGDLVGFDKLNVKRSKIPAVTHVDYSARMQTVSEESNYLFYHTINEFYNKTNCPVIINTSFNVRGEPIVCTPEDAFKCFMRTEMDYLVIGNFVLDKRNMPQWTEPKEVWQKEYVPD